MINITRDGTKVRLAVGTRIPTDKAYDYLFYWDCGCVEYAGLLSEAMRNQLGEVVKAARKEAYEQGFRDAKGKRRKNDWFSGAI
jgi:hypothetical protein